MRWHKPQTIMRRVASVLVDCATWLLPDSRADWARAMHSDAQHIRSDREALAWAFGCILAGMRQRIGIMITNDPKVSRCVLLLEALLCFAPLAIAWVDAFAGRSGIIMLDWAIVQQHFLDKPGGFAVLAWLGTVAIVGLLGPLSLIAAARLIATGRPAPVWLRPSMLVGAALLLIAIVASHDSAFVLWREIILLCLLPVAGVMHLFARGASSQPHVARDFV